MLKTLRFFQFYYHFNTAHKMSLKGAFVKRETTKFYKRRSEIPNSKGLKGQFKIFLHVFPDSRSSPYPYLSPEGSTGGPRRPATQCLSSERAAWIRSLEGAPWTWRMPLLPCAARLGSGASTSLGTGVWRLFWKIKYKVQQNVFEKRATRFFQIAPKKNCLF